MSKCVLDIKHITKEYKLYETQLDRLKESFNPFRKEYHQKFFALSDVNIQIMEGEKVGIIGANGAGKSTLLKILTGVLPQTSGDVVVDGKIAALLELGAGFNQDYTGIENVRLNGTLLGYSDEEIEEKMKKIIEFADIGDFINQPVKSYSSGMFVRLAFATQIFSEPDILIVDEALSVGDIRFQQKCYRAMDSLMENKTVVLVTHDTGAVTRFCKRVIWINHGQVMYDGETTEGLKRYQEFLINQSIEEHENSVDFDVIESSDVQKTQETLDMNIQTKSASKYTLPKVEKDVHIMGNRKAIITHCGLINEENRIVDLIEPEQMIRVVARVEFCEKTERPIFGITVNDRLGNIMFGVNSEMVGRELESAVGVIEYEMEFQMPQLNKGEYTVSIAIAEGYQQDHVQLCWLDDACVFRVKEREYDLPGFFYLSKGKIKEIKIK